MSKKRSSQVDKRLYSEEKKKEWEYKLLKLKNALFAEWREF